MHPGTKAILKTLYEFCKENGFKHFHMIFAEELLSTKKEDITIYGIKLIVTRFFRISLDLMDSKTRKREVVQARQIAQYMAIKFGYEYKKDWTLAYIGFEIGNKNHATVLHSRKTVNNLIETSRRFNHWCNDIEIEIRSKYHKTNDTEENIS